MRLYHYTCDHAYGLIRDDGFLRPNRQNILNAALLWATDLDVPDRYALGLTSETLNCDRMRHRIEVTEFAPVFERWGLWAHRRAISRAIRDGLELAPGARPAHWWVTENVIPVALSEVSA